MLQGKAFGGWGGGDYPYYCALCDKRYVKYTTFDNHINSYDHAHRQVPVSLVKYDVYEVCILDCCVPCCFSSERSFPRLLNTKKCGTGLQDGTTASKNAPRDLTPKSVPSRTPASHFVSTFFLSF